MALGYDGKLFILAFDHRGSFQKKWFGIEGEPSPEETQKITDSISSGFTSPVVSGTDSSMVSMAFVSSRVSPSRIMSSSSIPSV